MSKKPFRIIQKNGDLFITSPKRKDIYTDINLEDIEGSSILIETLKNLASENKRKAIEFLLLYKTLYNLSDIEVKRYSNMAGLGKPINTVKLSLIKDAICKRTFPLFISLCPDDTDLTSVNWIDFKVSILSKYLHECMKSNDYSLFSSFSKIYSLKDRLKTFFHSDCFEKNSNFKYFKVDTLNLQTVNVGQIIQLDVTGTLRINDNINKNQLEIGKCSKQKTSGEILIELEGRYAMLIKYVDFCLNSCLEQYLEKKGINYLDTIKQVF